MILSKKYMSELSEKYFYKYTQVEPSTDKLT